MYACRCEGQTTVKKGVCTIERGSHACLLAFPGSLCGSICIHLFVPECVGLISTERPHSDVSSCWTQNVRGSRTAATLSLFHPIPLASRLNQDLNVCQRKRQGNYTNDSIALRLLGYFFLFYSFFFFFFLNVPTASSVPLSGDFFSCAERGFVPMFLYRADCGGEESMRQWITCGGIEAREVGHESNRRGRLKGRHEKSLWGHFMLNPIFFFFLCWDIDFQSPREAALKPLHMCSLTPYIYTDLSETLWMNRGSVFLFLFSSQA